MNTAMIGEYTFILVPMAAAIAGIIGIFHNNGNAGKSRLSIVLVVLVALLCAFQIFENRTQKDETEDIKNQNQSLLEHLQSTSRSVDAVASRELEQLLKSFGMRADYIDVENLEDAPNEDVLRTLTLSRERAALQVIISNTPSIERAAIKYYTKERDNADLIRALRETGLAIEERIPEKKLQNTFTNAVWHGCDVDFKDYKIVVLTLMRAGIQLQRAGPANEDLANKINVIEVGYSGNMANKEYINLEAVISANSFADLDQIPRENSCP